MMSSSGKDNKLAIRAIRITRHLDDVLKADSVANQISVNGLISSILTRYDEWDRHVEKFGYVSISREFVKYLLEHVNLEDLDELATKQMPALVEETTLYWFKELTLETYVAWTLISYKYSGMAECDFTKDGEGNASLRIKTELGEKWAAFLGTVTSQTMKNLFGITPEIQQINNALVVRFKLDDCISGHRSSGSA